MNVYTFRAITNYDVIIVKKAKKTGAMQNLNLNDG